MADLTKICDLPEVGIDHWDIEWVDEGHTRLASFLSLMRFLNLSRQCSQNDTIYLHFIKEFDKVPLIYGQDGGIHIL